MWYVNNIINGIKKRKIIAILIIIQIIASFFFISVFDIRNKKYFIYL